MEFYIMCVQMNMTVFWCGYPDCRSVTVPDKYALLLELKSIDLSKETASKSKKLKKKE